MSADNNNEFRALVHLIDEPDSEIYALIKQRIINHGKDILPFLRESLDFSFQEVELERLRDLISIINLSFIKEELSLWKNMGAGNLLHGLFLVASYKYNNLEMDDVKKSISELEHDIWIEMNSSLTLLEKIKVFNHVFYSIHGFKPNKTDFHHPSNSFINDVLINKSGNPILLAGIYIIIARKLGLPVYGVNVPEHFICVVVNEGEDDSISFIPAGEPLFYINAFSYGALFTKVQLSSFLKQIKVPEKPEYFVPCSNVDIVLRVLNNLSFSFRKMKDTISEQEIEEIKLSLI